MQAIVVGKAIAFPIRPLCRALGMARQRQIKNLKADSRFAEAFRALSVAAAKGVRVTWRFNRRSVAMGLATIDPDQCPLKAKGLIARFQH
jgi:hypothetical protein